jgi:hypothetical protein
MKQTHWLVITRPAGKSGESTEFSIRLRAFEKTALKSMFSGRRERLVREVVAAGMKRID